MTVELIHPTKRAAILRPADMRHVLRVTEASSRYWERDCLLLLISITVGMRCTEIAQILVSDVMWPNGKWRAEVLLRAAITKGCRPRIAYFTNAKLIAALNAYSEFRLRKGVGVDNNSQEYRGLAPDLPLIFSGQKGGFALQRKKRVLESGVIEIYLAADSLEHHYRRLYDRAGLKSCSSHAGRRTFASKLLALGIDSEKISQLLGHVQVDHSIPYIEIRPETIANIFESALS